jgi:phosphonopyruvate decarboxylase
VTIAGVAPRNLVHFVSENGTYEANGGHPTPMGRRLSFAGLARAAGYRNCYEFSDLPTFEKEIAVVLSKEGPTFVDLKIEPGAPPPKDYKYMHSAEVRTAFKAALKQA